MYLNGLLRCFGQSPVLGAPPKDDILVSGEANFKLIVAIKIKFCLFNLSFTSVSDYNFVKKCEIVLFKFCRLNFKLIVLL